MMCGRTNWRGIGGIRRLVVVGILAVAVGGPVRAVETSCHGLCTQGPPMDPACDPCVEAICAVDAWCCSTEWDILCVEKVTSVCGIPCSPPCPGGVCTCALQWSGAAYQNSATASGVIQIDQAMMSDPGISSLANSPWVVALGVIVSGASSGNGTFNLTDFAGGGDVILETNGGILDMTAELVGQPTAGDLWGTGSPDGSGGSFSLVPNGTNPAAPASTFYFELTTNGGFGDPMLLSSFDCVPAPATGTPTATPTPTPTSATALCAPTPLSGCASAPKGTLKLVGNASDATKQKLTWKWSNGTAAPADFGDPIDGTTNYRLCVYDDGVLKMSPAVAAGGMCDGDSCWSLQGTTGVKYRNRLGNADGITMLKLRSGAGRAKILVKGKGANLALPFPVTDATGLTVQLVQNPGAGGRCWVSTYPAPPTASDPARPKLVDKVP